MGEVDAIMESKVSETRNRAGQRPEQGIRQEREEGTMRFAKSLLKGRAGLCAPGVLSGCVEYRQAHGVRDICVAESPWVGARTEQATKASGYDKVCQRYGVPFYGRPQPRTRSLCSGNAGGEGIFKTTASHLKEERP